MDRESRLSDEEIKIDKIRQKAKSASKRKQKKTFNSIKTTTSKEKENPNLVSGIMIIIMIILVVLFGLLLFTNPDKPNKKPKTQKQIEYEKVVARADKLEKMFPGLQYAQGVCSSDYRVASNKKYYEACLRQGGYGNYLEYKKRIEEKNRTENKSKKGWVTELSCKPIASSPPKRNIAADNLLFKAAKNGNSQGIKNSLKMGAYVNARNENGYTPLMFAAGSGGDKDVIKVLIENGADINAKDTYKGKNTGLSAIDHSKYNKYDIITIMLSKCSEFQKDSTNYKNTAELTYDMAKNALQRFSSLSIDEIDKVLKTDCKENFETFSQIQGMLIDGCLTKSGKAEKIADLYLKKFEVMDCTPIHQNEIGINQDEIEEDGFVNLSFSFICPQKHNL